MGGQSWTELSTAQRREWQQSEDTNSHSYEEIVTKRDRCENRKDTVRRNENCDILTCSQNYECISHKRQCHDEHCYQKLDFGVYLYADIAST